MLLFVKLKIIKSQDSYVIRYHLFFYACIAFLFGVALASFHFGFWALVFSIACVFLGAIISVVRTDKRFFLVSLLSLFIPLGAFYMGYAEARGEPKGIVYEEKLEFVGIIDGNPEIRRGAQEFFMSIEIPFRARALVKVSNIPLFKYGEQLVFEGTIERPFSESYAGYLASRRAHGVIHYPNIISREPGYGSKIKEVLYAVRNFAAQSMKKALPQEEAAFLSGITLGGRSEFSAELEEAMRKSGTTHLVALSGYNITVLINAVLLVLSKMLPLRISSVAVVFFVVGFVIMTGAEASVVRAGIIGLLVLFSRRRGGRKEMRNVFAFTALLMILWNPFSLVFDVGFQLSFLALLGIVYLAPAFRRRLGFSDGDSGFLLWKENLLQTGSAQIAVLPILISQFSQFSLTSILSNMLILGFIPVTMFLGFCSAFAAVFSYYLSLAVAWVAGIFLKFEIGVIQIFSETTLLINPSWNAIMTIGYYSLIILFLVYERKRINALSRV